MLTGRGPPSFTAVVKSGLLYSPCDLCQSAGAHATFFFLLTRLLQLCGVAGSQLCAEVSVISGQVTVPLSPVLWASVRDTVPFTKQKTIGEFLMMFLQQIWLFLSYGFPLQPSFLSIILCIKYCHNQWVLSNKEYGEDVLISGNRRNMSSGRECFVGDSALVRY